MVKQLKKVIAETAVECTKHNVNSACLWVFHQPKLPVKAVEKLKK